MDRSGIEICGVRFKSGTGPISLFSIYIPSGPNKKYISLESLTAIGAITNDTSLLVGDFNAKLQETGHPFTCSLGRKVRDFMDFCDLVLLNDDSITHRPANGTTPSSIDLALCSTSLGSKVIWYTLDHMYTSDHYPCVIDFISPHQGQFFHVKRPLRKWCTGSANWSVFQQSFTY